MSTPNNNGVSSNGKASISGTFGLLPKITCPHCWHKFSPSQILWVSQHQDLVGDSVVTEAQRRFLPSRFTHDCQAIDARGLPCQLLACPHCHLLIPRVLTHKDPFFLSIIGGPSSGKTWLLTSMIWQLRRTMPSHFKLIFSDADTLANVLINENEAKLFLSENPDALVNLMKTEEKGAGFYDEVTLAGQPVQLPKPFVFNFNPTAGHPQAGMDSASRVICLYDNAGESFQPGHDTSLSPTTQHLAKSRALFFLFDPTQDPRFRETCRQFSQDPQLRSRPKIKVQAGESAMSQHTLMLEAAQRIRRYAGIASGKKFDRPLIVVVSKSDVWGQLVDEDLVAEPYVAPTPPQTLYRVDIERIDRISNKIREVLLKWTPEIVSAAEEFCRWVIYIPVSALGSCPEPLPDAPGMFGSRPRNINPRWATVPFTYLFARWSVGTIPVERSATTLGAQASSTLP